MTADTKGVARWDLDYTDMRHTRISKLHNGDYVLFTDHEQVVAELTASVHELERLCAAGRDPGTEDSLRDGLTWAHGELVEAESEITRLRSALAAKSAEVERLRLVVNRARGISVMDDVYQLNQALDEMEKSNEHQNQ